ncbi:MAG: hypothetical protein Q8K02_17075 [Flavobacterium sp.]|nr:hypothetical protein [Flavobacterium sp.]
MTPTAQIKKLATEILELEDELKALEIIDTYNNGLDPKLKAIIDGNIKMRERTIKLINLLDL